jgi:hypothetical protein
MTPFVASMQVIQPQFWYLYRIPTFVSQLHNFAGINFK